MVSFSVVFLLALSYYFISSALNEMYLALHQLLHNAICLPGIFI